MKVSKLISLFAIMAISCQNFDYSSKGKDVPTAGNIVIGVDQGDSFLITEELDYFHQDYPKAKIRPKFLCEIALLRQLQQDSMRFVVMNRDFTKSEKENLERRDILVRSEKIAETSIAVICHKSNRIDSITQAMLKQILAGKMQVWPNSEPITTLFDGACGSNYEYLAKVFLKGKIEAANLGSFNNPKQLIDYVSSHPNAIGFVGLNWISDRTDAQSANLASMVKVLKVENVKDKLFYLPFQSQIKAKLYPFVQTVYMHDLQGYNGLAKGFISFVASQPGQILIKRSGLIPAHDYGRTIFIESE